MAGCGLLNLAGSITAIGSAAHIQIQGYLAAKGMAPEFPIPRATKMELGWGCRKADTPFGFADLARRATTGFELAEIKPISARTLAKLEVGPYRRRARQSMQRFFKVPGACARRPAGFDDEFFVLLNGLTAVSDYSLLTGVLSGDETIGPFTGDPSLTLKAKEASPGAVCYWCTKNPSPQPAKPPGPSVGLGVSIGGSSGGAYNAGVGVSIMSDSTAYGTAGAGISYKSDSKAAGAAGAGASVESDTVAAGAGVAGAGASSGSVSAAAGAAGAGTSKASATAGAGVAGKGAVKDSAVAGAGVSGSGTLEGVSGVGTKSPDKPVNAKDTPGGETSGSQMDATTEGAAEGARAGDVAARGTRAGAAPSKGGSESASAKGAQGAQEAGADPGSGGTAGGQITGAGGSTV